MSYAPAGNLTTTGSIAHYPTVWYNRRGLHKLTKRFRFYNCCEPDMIPNRSGKTVQFFRYTQLSANVTPAGEGAVGTSNTLTSTTVSGSVSEYQDFITVSTLLVETIIDPVVTNAAELLGYSAGLSVDTIIRTAADGQSGAVLSPGTLGMTASVNDLRRCKAILEATDVPPKDDKYYYSVIHPYIKYDIASDNTAGGFIDLMKFADPKVFIDPANPFEAAVGVVDNIKIWESTNVATSGSAPNVLYSGYVFGRGGLGAVDLQGSGPTKVENPTTQQFKINVVRGGPQIADPSGMIGAAVSYRYVFLSLVLDTVNLRYRIFKADAGLV